MTPGTALRGLGACAAFLASLVFTPVCDAETPGVSGFGLDNSFRDFARAPSAAGRSRADAVSYVTFGFGLAEPLFFDAYELLGEHDDRGALGAFVIDVSTLAVGFTVNHFALKPAFGGIGFDNLRPMAGECLIDPGYDGYCTTSDLRQGNPSDHAALAAMGFGLTLAKIATDPRFPRSPWIVGGAIAFGALGMLSTDYLRVAADKHWLSETLMGDAVGLAFGFGMPVVAHAMGLGYRRWERVSVHATPTRDGFAVGASVAF